jgi:FMN hydrolase / 5-amino-6-(5-phospho-D-ribitylamino)uracil phosphatase
MPVNCSSDTCPVPVLMFAIIALHSHLSISIFFFCRMSMKELLEAKHPTAWSEFEKGLIDEVSSRCLV